ATRPNFSSIYFTKIQRVEYVLQHAFQLAIFNELLIYGMSSNLKTSAIQAVMFVVIVFIFSCKSHESHEDETESYIENTDSQYSIVDPYNAQKELVKFRIPNGYKTITYQGLEYSNYSNSTVVMVYPETSHLDGLYMTLAFSKSSYLCYYIPENAKVQIFDIFSINGIKGCSKRYINNEKYYRQDYYPSESMYISVDYAPVELKSLTDSILDNLQINI
ncbi:MAG: hypothetical protein NC336_08525, partial [Clostridium sp.]|nr:hypothetical protein [Clostridium sp.]